MANYEHTFKTEVFNQNQWSSKSVKDIDYALIKWVTMVGGPDVHSDEINLEFCAKLIKLFKSKKLSNGTQRTYLSRLNTLLHKIQKDMAPNFTYLVPPMPTSHKSVLSEADVTKLYRTPCHHKSTAQAFIFAMNTALRYSDIVSLTWGDLSVNNGEISIQKKMVKTGLYVEVEVNSLARGILQIKALEQRTTIERADSDALVFHNLMSYNTIRTDLHRWARDARISVRNLTFHVSRHTFASVVYANDIPLATISRLLGHRSIITTETYIHSFKEDEHSAVQLVSEYGRKRKRNTAPKNTKKKKKSTSKLPKIGCPPSFRNKY